MENSTKVCSKCGEEKSISEFHKDKSTKDGLKSYCKSCAKEYKKAYRHTKEGLARQIYGHQKLSSKRRNHPLPNYTSDKLKEWLFSQKLFHELFDNWKASGFDKMMVPSCDRIDDYKPYTLENLQLMSWNDNFLKGHRDRKNGVNNKMNKPVIQLTLDGQVVGVYHSMMQASRETGINVGNIHSACNGRYKTAGGFKWKYKD